MLTTFRSNPEINILSVYAPTENATDSGKDSFYADLERCIHSLPNHNLVLVSADLNARVGADNHAVSPRAIGRHCYHSDTNDNGEILVALCESLSLRPAQHRFSQPSRRQWTWTHSSVSKAQIDHILIRSKWVNSLRNCRSYSSEVLDLDQARIVVTEVKLNLR